MNPPRPSLRDYATAVRAAINALRVGRWSLRGLVGTLAGVPRDEKGHVLAWCPHCDLAIWPEEELRSPAEDMGDGTFTCETVCPRCLKGPTTEEDLRRAEATKADGERG